MAIDINSIKYIPDLPAAKALNGADLFHISQAAVDGQLTLSTLLRWFNDQAHPIGEVMFFGVKGKNPNNSFPGQTWVRTLIGRTVRGCASDESNLGTNVGADSVSLNSSHIPSHTHAVNINTNSVGNHTHTVTIAAGGTHNHSGTTEGGGAHTHTASTGGAGEHRHEYGGDDQLYAMGATKSRNGGYYDADSDTDSIAAWYWTSTVGNHTHTVSVAGAAAHTHTFTTSTVGNHTHVATASTTGEHVHNVSGNTGAWGAATVTAVPTLNATTYVAAWVRTA